MRSCSFFLLLGVLAAGQEIHVPCEAPAKTLALLADLPSILDVDAHTFEERVGPLRQLALQNPDDLFINRRYQDAFRRAWFYPDEYDRALKMYRSRDHKLARYWEARLLMTAQPALARETFAKLKETDPQFVWPLIDELEWLRLPGKRDPAAADQLIRAFLKICPESVALLDGGLVQDEDLLQKITKGARAALERRNSTVDLARWPELWTLESRLEPNAETFRARIRKDLERIDALPFRATQDLRIAYHRTTPERRHHQAKLRAACWARSARLLSSAISSRAALASSESKPRPRCHT